MKKQFLSFLLLSFIFLTAFGEDTSKIKFGKVSENELSMTSYAADTAAVAVILSDVGTSDVEYQPEQGFAIQFNRHVRIKILKQQGVEWGNFKVLLYKSPNSKEEIGSLKGLTFNIEGGQVLKSELKKEAIFTEKENKFWEATRFSLPAVKVGSVIDVQYRITSNILWNLRSWKFQYEIPVKWSEYTVSYPEYFLYNQTMMGFHPLSNHKTEQNPSSFRISNNETLSFLRTRHYYLSKNVPGIKEEPFMTTIDNYTSKIEFELAQTDFSKIGGTYKNYTTSWEDVAKELLSDDDFGAQIKNGNFANDIIKEHLSDSKDNLQKAIKIYEYIKSKVKWNEYNSVYSSKPLRKVLNDGYGNVADINLLLTLMLNRAGIDSYPVILSTRNNGILSPAHASISRCNYVIVQASIDGKKYLLDATESKLPFGLIPFRCLNGEGRLIKENEPIAVSLNCNKRVTNNLLNLSFDENHELTGELNSRFLGHDALNLREEIKEAGGEKEYIETLKNKNSELEILECKISNLDSIYSPLTNKFQVKLKNSNDMMDNEMVYLDPVLVARMKDNPFSAPSREFPIDFGATFNETYQIQLTIPKGYVVDELPKTASYSTEGKSGSFIYQATQLGDKIIINTILSVEKPNFAQTEYLIIKNFFDTVIAKQTEQIVLKKAGI